MKVLSDTITIDAPPDDVFEFFRTMDEDRYLAWHPEHEVFRFVEGDVIGEGNVAYFEEWIGDDYHEMTVRYTQVRPNELIEFRVRNPLVRLFFPKSTFEFEAIDNGTRFTARNYFRVGPLASRSRYVQSEFADAQRHMREEGENLKELVESGQFDPRDTE